MAPYGNGSTEMAPVGIIKPAPRRKTVAKACRAGSVESILHPPLMMTTIFASRNPGSFDENLVPSDDINSE